MEINRNYSAYNLSIKQLQSIDDCSENLERHFGITIISRGYNFIIKGSRAQEAVLFIDYLINSLLTGGTIASQDFHNMLENYTDSQPTEMFPSTILTKKKNIILRNKSQKTYIKSIQDNTITFGIGPAGTGKTYLGVAKAVEALSKGLVNKIVLSRPSVEAGEKLGYLPGGIKEKVDPFLRPLYDALEEMLPIEYINNAMEKNIIEVAPIAFMRGRTLKNAFIIIDEAQNATFTQLKMLLSRIGENSQMLLNGDLTQVDLPYKEESGLAKVIGILKNVPNINVHYFSNQDIVRSQIVNDIITAFDKSGKAGTIG